MARGKKHTSEQIVNVLRQVEMAVRYRNAKPAACRDGGIMGQTYYRGRGAHIMGLVDSGYR